jgi:hypothetical protein
MTKLDVTNVPRELDELIKVTPSRRQQQILDVVRRHYLLELIGQRDEIFAPDMMVEDPVYLVNVDGSSRTLRGRAEIMAFYQEQDGVVLATDSNVHAVSDAGYWSVCWFNFFVPGEALGLDGAWYLKRHWITMFWPFDERARVAGEQVYEHADRSEIVPIDPADVITFEETCKQLEPLLRPLPTYPAAGRPAWTGRGVG